MAWIWAGRRTNFPLGKQPTQWRSMDAKIAQLIASDLLFSPSPMRIRSLLRSAGLPSRPIRKPLECGDPLGWKVDLASVDLRLKERELRLLVSLIDIDPPGLGRRPGIAVPAIPAGLENILQIEGGVFRKDPHGGFTSSHQQRLKALPSVPASGAARIFRVARQS